MRLHSKLLVLLLLISLGLNVWLSRQVSQIREYWTSTRVLSSGDIVPEMILESMNGDLVRWRYGSESLPTVLYSFAPNCGWCMRNVANIRALEENLRGRFRMLSISRSRDHLEEYLADFDHRMPVFVDAGGFVRQSYKLGLTPQTIVISGDGRVIKNWSGAFEGAVRRAIEEYFEVSLPGLLELTKEGAPSSDVEFAKDQ